MKLFVVWIVAFLSVVLPFTRICAAENFRVMLYTDSFPPYFFEKGNVETGIVRDIFAALAKETGDSFEYVRVPFKRGLHHFETGQIDIEPMSNPVWRQTSAVKGIFSIPFAVSEEIVLFDAEQYLPVDSPEDLIGHTVGVVMGYQYPVYGPYFADGLIKAHPLRDENKLIQLLLAGRLGQALMNKDFAQYQIKTLGLKGRLIIGKPCSVVDMMIRFHPSKKHAVPRLNKAIEKLLKNGTIKSIYDKYS